MYYHGVELVNKKIRYASEHQQFAEPIDKCWMFKIDLVDFVKGNESLVHQHRRIKKVVDIAIYFSFISFQRNDEFVTRI